MAAVGIGGRLVAERVADECAVSGQPGEGAAGLSQAAALPAILGSFSGMARHDTAASA